MFLCVQPDTASAAGTPCSITPVLTEADLDTCIAEAPTDNSEFDITLGANFNLATQKTIAAGKNITLASINPASPAILTRDAGFVGRMFFINVSGPTTLTIDSVIIEGNNQPAAANNQLIHTVGTGEVTVNLTGNTILRNNYNAYAAYAGGAIFINGTGHKLNLSGNVQITNNTSGAGGGGIASTAGNTLNMSGNVIVGGNSAGGYGGGISMTDSTFVMSSGTVSGNTAGAAGGGVRVSGTFIMTGGEISGNTAARYGGGVTLADSVVATFTMTGGKISGNTAVSSTGRGGGGVRVGENNTFDMSGGVISDNASGNHGGGIQVDYDGIVNISGNAEISGNTSSFDGGGIWIEHDNLTNLTVGASAVFSGNSAATATRMNPADQALYNAQIFATSFSLPLPFNGYNNFDISYASDLSTDICQHNSSLWADDTKCVSVPGTGLFGGQVGGATISVLSLIVSGVMIVVVWTHKKSRRLLW